MNHHKISGMTMIELILVLAIATSLILMGLTMYRSAQIDKDYFILQSDVDFLFQAMKGYYQQQCDLAFSSQGTLSTRGALTFNPGGGSPASSLAPVSFDVTTVPSYIDFAWPRFTTVVASGTSNNVYFAQFNPNTVTKNKNVYACSTYATGTAQCLNPIPITSSNIILWQSQIVVKMKDPTKTTYYVAKVGADCAVNTYTVGDVVDCSTGKSLGSSAQYMVWQRMPSFSSPDIQSSHWVSNPVTKEFKLQYTHDPMYEMYNPSATPPDVYNYYYCGG